MTAERLPKRSRVLKRAEFLSAQRDALRVHSTHFVLLVHRRAPDGLGMRLGLIASRKMGGAVARNRAKRLVREWFRKVPEREVHDTDLLVILRAGSDACGSALWSRLDEALAKGLAARRRVGSGTGPRRA